MSEKISSDQKRILVVSQHFWPENFRVNDIAEFLKEADCSIDILCGLPNYPKGELYKGYKKRFFQREIHENVTIYRIFEVLRGNNSNVRIFLNYISFPFFASLCIPFFLFKRYDRILLYETSPVFMAFPGILLGKLKRIKTVMYVLDLWPENLYSVISVKNKYLRFLLKKVSHWHYRKVDKLIVLSKAMEVKIKSFTKKRDDDVVIIPQVCEELYAGRKYDKHLQERFALGFNLVFTGNISPAQSFETVLDAACMLKKKGIADINWIIVGDGMSSDWLCEQVFLRKLTDQFYFEGYKPITEVPKYTTIAHALFGCLVKSELLEATIPAKVLSYIASRKPVILAMDGEIRDTINDNNCGFAGPAGDAASLAENIEKVYRLSIEERQIMEKNCSQLHSEQFDRNKNMWKLYNFLFS